MIIRRFAGYLVALAVILYLFFMYNETVLSGILIFALVYPVFSLIWLLRLRSLVSTAMERIPPVGEKNQRIRAGIVVRNRSRFWNCRYILDLTAGRRQEKKNVRSRIRGTVGAAEETTVWCGLETDLCGKIEVRAEYIWIFDPIGIFCIRKKISEKQSVKVMPKFELMPVEITRKTREYQADADEYSGEKKGDDPSEIYQIREYRTRDPVRDIHWKMSAKEDTLMVKEKGFPLGCVVLIWIDLSEKERSRDSFSRVLESAASLSVTLAGEKCVHMAAWYNEAEARVIKWPVRDEMNAYEMIWSLMDAEYYHDAEKKKVCYDDAFRGQNFSTIVVIDGQGNMIRDGVREKLLQI